MVRGTTVACALRAFVSVTIAQRPGALPEVHPKLTTYICTIADGCQSYDSALVLDSMRHPIHQLQYPNLTCGRVGKAPNVTACPDVDTCQTNCIIEGISDYANHGVTTDGDVLRLQQVANASSALHLQQRQTAVRSLHPRVYLLTPDETQYQPFTLNGQEFAFDVDVSQLPCGMNGALYLVEMDLTGGQSTLNTGGAEYGTGYCDAQCRVFPFIEGVGNIDGDGSCCNEIDIWEANSQATSMSHEDYYGSELTVDTSQPFTVVTRFKEEDGVLVAIQRAYIQGGRFISNKCLNLVERTARPSSITDEYCCKSGASRYLDMGGNQAVGEALDRGMVLAMSLWWDTDTFMNWLDSGSNGPCSTTEGNPTVIVEAQPNPVVTFSNIRWGEIGSTYPVADQTLLDSSVCEV
ncbi:Glucanase [Pleurostoma richardsiae]|uniref:Glucanase n=1 Tax=Pleurostoma richardsiae TaxID=41990 RepID=A0AA38RX89_9PEZI|nr:Glucanase [Pleurostoma richardsiae]